MTLFYTGHMSKTCLPLFFSGHPIFLRASPRTGSLFSKQKERIYSCVVVNLSDQYSKVGADKEVPCTCQLRVSDTPLPKPVLTKGTSSE